MQTKSHKKLAKKLAPKVDVSDIDRINAAIDNPSSAIRESDARLPTMPGADNRGHRRKGHDLFTATIIGFVVAGVAGIAVALIHLFADAARDQVRERAGTGVADMMEGGVNALLEWDEKRRRVQ